MDTIHRITYNDLKNDFNIEYNDDLQMLSDYLTPSVINTLLANPNLKDFTDTAVNLIIRENVIVGRNMLMPTCIKTIDGLIPVQTGGSFEINEKYRGNGLGTMIFKNSIFNNKRDVYIGQLYSSSALAIIQKLNLNIFELPSYYKLCNSRILLESKGFHGWTLKVGTLLANSIINLLDFRSVIRLRKLKKNYRIVQKTKVPKWVEDLTLRDGHDFAEAHDCKWLQWCLDYKFTSHPYDKQAFFAVYDANSIPKGFFMIKERFEALQGAYKNLTRGFVVEWGSYDENELNEVDLNLIAVSCFGKNVDNITTILSDVSYDKPLKKLGFIRHGSYQFSIKTESNYCGNILDQNRWRIRFGGCNTIVY